MLFLVAVSAPLSRASANNMSMIRDAEVENTIRAYATPLLEVAGIDPQSVSIYLVKDNRLNAFVAGGLNVFFNTGLLMRAEAPEQVIGVLAHEIGHMAGGHLSRLHDAAGRATAESIVAMVLGAAATMATGRGDVGAAVIMGGQHAAQRNFLSHTRAQESAADQAAVNYLDATGQSARGLLRFMEILEGQDLLQTERQDPYVRTHPLTRDRIDFLRAHVARSPHSDAPSRPGYEEMHERMRAKLYAFLESPVRTLRRYPETDTSFVARYAQAIAYYRRPDLGRAIPLIDELIAERPEDPYLHELKGQMLFENGRAEEALAPYREAVRLLPHPLLQISLAQVQIELGTPDMLEEARQNLSNALKIEGDNGFAWRLYATALGRLGEEGLAAYAMAEHALLGQRLPEAAYYANRAEQLLPQSSPTWLRTQDIKAETERLRENQKR